MNIINGGAHADTGVDIQEFMVLPVGADDLLRGPALGRRDLPRAQGPAEGEGPARTGLGDEGGFAPDLPTQPRGARPHRSRRSARPASRPARTSPSASTSPRPSSSRTARTTSRARSCSGRGADRVLRRARRATYPLVSIEDPLAEDDWDGWTSPHRRARRQGAARRRRPLRHQPGAPGRRHRQARPPTRSW